MWWVEASCGAPCSRAREEERRGVPFLLQCRHVARNKDNQFTGLSRNQLTGYEQSARTEPVRTFVLETGRKVREHFPYSIEVPPLLLPVALDISSAGSVALDQ